MTSEPTIEHRDFLERALTSASEWARFADPKLLGVLVLLGLGAKDLVDHAHRFLHPHEPATATCDVLFLHASGHSCAGIGATVGGILAAAFAAATVVFLTHGLFPRLRMRGLLRGEQTTGAINSMFYFAEVARHGSQQAYRVAVKQKTEQELLDDIAGQVYEVSTIASSKHLSAQRAFALVLIFLVIWGAARIALSSVT